MISSETESLAKRQIEMQGLAALAHWLRTFAGMMSGTPPPIEQRRVCQSYMHIGLMGLMWAIEMGKLPDTQTWASLEYSTPDAVRWYAGSASRIILASEVPLGQWSIAPEELVTPLVNDATAIEKVRGILEPAVRSALLFAKAVSTMTPEHLQAARWN